MKTNHNKKIYEREVGSFVTDLHEQVSIPRECRTGTLYISFIFPCQRIAWPFERRDLVIHEGRSHRVIFEFPVEQFQLITTYILLVSQPDVDKAPPSRQIDNWCSSTAKWLFLATKETVFSYFFILCSNILPGRDRRLQTPYLDRRWSLSADVPEWVAL